jgi:hypothetical protein
MLKLIQNGIKYSKKISLSECKACGNYLYYQNRLIIPDYNEFKLKLLKYIHNLLVARHLG